MKENKKAVTVAKDVLKHLTGYKVVAANGYIKYPNNDFDTNQYFGLCKTEITKKIQKDCEVCALGACLVAAFNTDFAQPTHLLSFLSESFDSGMLQLKTIFGDNYRKIEDAFESCEYDEYDEHNDVTDFGLKFDDDKERLRAIMQNIVDNKGNFVPGKEGVKADKYLKAAKRRKR